PHEVDALIRLVAGHPAIRFRGPVKEVDKVLRQYSVFIMTSHYEGFGQTLIEARSQGLPIVAFDTFDALSWIVRHGENGFRVTPGDHVDFALRIQTLTADCGQYERFSRAALTLARDTESAVIDRLWQTLLLRYGQSVVAGPQTPSHSAAS